MELDRVFTAATMKRQIDGAADTAALRSLRDGMAETALRWRGRGCGSLEILQAVNRWHDWMIARVVELTVHELETGGLGSPPAPYSWMLLGSGGRKEQALWPDQDNALVYEEVPGLAEQARDYFSTLGDRVVLRLQEAGYPSCSGFVMAANPRWNGSLEAWKARLEGYLQLPSWDHVRYLMMAADLRPAAGDASLAEELRAWMTERLREAAFVHWQAADRGKSRPVALDFRGRLRTDLWGEHAGAVDVKEGGYLQAVSLTRLWAAANGIGATSTEERVLALQAEGVWEVSFATEVEAAFAALCRRRLWGNHVRPSELTGVQAAELKAALKTVKRLQKRSAKAFGKPSGW